MYRSARLTHVVSRLSFAAGLLLSLNACAFQMKIAAPAHRSVQLADAAASCETVASHFFWFFGEQRVIDHDLQKVDEGKKVRITLRQNFWEIMINGASFGLVNFGSLKLESCGDSALTANRDAHKS